MIFYIFLCSLFVISEQSDNSTLTLLNLKNITSGGADNELLNKTKQSLVSEGGNLLPNTSDITLPKQTSTSYLTLEEEILDKTKEKSSVPRKGVDNLLAADLEIPTQDKSNHSVTLESDKLNTDSKNSSITTITSTKSNIQTTTLENKTMVLKELKKQNQSEIHKPTILSYEALADMEKKIKSDQSKLPIVPSTKTIANNQIPSPNENTVVKLYPAKANSHPGMIMPVVITILVVPMFAIVGYMALRRGQEAWKNRHYKRMDFLLDGMYND